ncbi:CapA family protein [Chloroflexota bacterium]
MAKELIVMLAGDIFISTPEVYPEIGHSAPILTERADLYTWLEGVAPVLQQGDFTLGNLEGPICERGVGTGSNIYGDVNTELRMPPEVADILKRAGFSAVSVAGNITMNMGNEGIIHTVANLDRVGVGHAGGGRNIVEARKPAIMERDGVKLALLSYSSIFQPGIAPAGENKPGIATVAVSTAYHISPNILYNPGVPPRIITTPNPKDVEAMWEDVRQARAQADVVVVSWHWGATKYANSYAFGIPVEDAPFYVLGYQEEMGRAAIDAGADLIMGHHPHRLQGMELYKGKLICYGLCNLTMSFFEGPNFGVESVIVKGCIDAESKKLTRFTIIPLIIPSDTMEPHIVPVSEAGDVIAELAKQSKKYGTRFQVEKGEITISSPSA